MDQAAAAKQILQARARIAGDVSVAVAAGAQHPIHLVEQRLIERNMLNHLGADGAVEGVVAKRQSERGTAHHQNSQAAQVAVLAKLYSIAMALLRLWIIMLEPAPASNVRPAAHAHPVMI